MWADLLETRLAGDSVFWSTGHVDSLTVAREARKSLTVLFAGWAVIVVLGLIVGWRLRRRKFVSSDRTGRRSGS